MNAERGTKAVQDYIVGKPEKHQQTLLQIRTIVLALLPHATEGLKWNMPAFILGDKGVIGYAAFKHHCSLFPMSNGIIELLNKELVNFKTSKGTILIELGKPPSKGLLQKLIKHRITELGQASNGKRYEYFADGQLKAIGSAKDGLVHGKWQWYRSDGSLIRTGQYKDGEKIGEWKNYPRN